MKFGKVNAAVRVQNALISTDIDNPADDVAILGDFEQLALHGDRQLVNQRRVHKRASGRVKTGFFHLLGLAVGRDHAHIV